jgi:O-antigen ligase
MVLISTGLVGFIPYLLMLIFIVTDSIKLYRQVGSNPNIFIDRGLIAVFWGSAFTYVFKSFSGQQSAVMSNVLFMLIIGVVVGSQEAALALDKHK